MKDTPPTDAYLIPRGPVEQVLKEKGVVAGKVIPKPLSQLWHIKGGPTFALQIWGEEAQYYDQSQVSYAYDGVADWQARNPNNVH